jgi:hypothetical protein
MPDESFVIIEIANGYEAFRLGEAYQGDATPWWQQGWEAARREEQAWIDGHRMLWDCDCCG